MYSRLHNVISYNELQITNLVDFQKILYTTVSYWCAKAAGVNTSIIEQTTNISCEDNYDREYSKLIVCSILIIINTN